MRYSIQLALILSLFVHMVAHAGVVTTGNVIPSAPGTWDESTLAYVGKTSDGTLTIDAGSEIISEYCDIGFNSEVMGAVMIAGSGSAWTSNSTVGFNGSGKLDVTNGGTFNGSVVAGEGVGSSGVVNILGAGSTWTAGNAFVGNRGNGELNIIDGGVVSNNDGLYHSSYIGYEAGSTGKATVDGAGSTWNMVDGGTEINDFYVGYYGKGELCVTNGGIVLNIWSNVGRYLNSSGTVTVSGQLSRWSIQKGFFVGGQGEGELNIIDGGQVFAGSYFMSSIGYESGAIGTVTVSGSNSAFDCSGDFSVGYYGTGHLNVLDGGRFFEMSTDHPTVIGREVGSTGTVLISGAGSICKGYIKVGGSGTGQIDIIDGGTLEGGGPVGCESGSSGTVNVSGNGSAWTGGYLNIANQGVGNLNITNAGMVSAEYFSIGLNQGSTGTVTVAGVGSELTVSNPASSYASICVGDMGAGELNIIDGGLAKAFELTIDDNGDGDSFINMATGGMLALKGDVDDSLTMFLNSVQGTDAIRWWDKAIDDWALLATTATVGTDYTLEYLAEGDLAGYTVLTVGTVPEPGGVMLLLTTLLAAGLVPALKTRDGKRRR